MFRWTSRKALAAGAAVMLIASLGGRGVQAAPTCTGTILNLPGGSGNATLADISGGNCVVTQDKEYGNLVAGNLPAGTTLSFNLTNVAGADHHQLSFNGTFSSGTTYNFGYEVAVTGTIIGSAITSLDADFTQTAGGPSTLTKNTTPTGIPAGGITETKIGPIVQPGSILTIAYPNILDLIINETLVDNGTISSVTNTIIQTVTSTPEPASLMLLGFGLASLGVFRRVRR